MAIWQTLKSAIVGVGVGEATADALTPILNPAAQDAWAKNPYRALAASIVAEAQAQGLVSASDAAGEASLTGTGPQRLTVLVQTLLKAPSVAEGLTLLRRQAITPAEFTHLLRKAMLEPSWDAAIRSLQDQRLTPAEVALGMVRSTVADEGLLVTHLDTNGSNVAQYPVYPGSGVEEAAAHGFNRDRLRVLVGSVGLPMPPVRAASAFFRSILTRGAYNQAILESDTRPEWADAILAEARQILTAREYVEGELRGFLSGAERLAGTDKHGMSQADSDLLYNTVGRGLGPHAITTGLARGGVYPGSYADVPDPWKAGLQRSNIRPEFADLAYANRYTLPSAFIIRTLLKDGAITADQGNTLLLESGWPPEWARLVADHYAASSPTTTARHASSAVTSAITQVRNAYTGGDLTQAEAATQLTTLGIGAAEQTAMFNAWNVIRHIFALPPTPVVPPGP